MMGSSTRSRKPAFPSKAQTHASCAVFFQSAHTHKTTREQWDDYVSKREKQEQIFLQLRESAAVVQQHGIHVGYCDDTELAKAINYSLKLSELFRADDIARQIAGFEGHLLKTERFLIDQGGEGDMIVL